MATFNHWSTAVSVHYLCYCISVTVVVYTTTNYPDSKILITRHEDLVVSAVNFNYEIQGAAQVN